MMSIVALHSLTRVEGPPVSPWLYTATSDHRHEFPQEPPRFVVNDPSGEEGEPHETAAIEQVTTRNGRRMFTNSELRNSELGFGRYFANFTNASIQTPAPSGALALPSKTTLRVVIFVP